MWRLIGFVTIAIILWFVGIWTTHNRNNGLVVGIVLGLMFVAILASRPA